MGRDAPALKRLDRLEDKYLEYIREPSSFRRHSIDMAMKPYASGRNPSMVALQQDPVHIDIDMTWDPPRYYLRDGRHRWLAAIHAGAGAVPAYVRMIHGEREQDVVDKGLRSVGIAASDRELTRDRVGAIPNPRPIPIDKKQIDAVAERLARHLFYAAEAKIQVGQAYGDKPGSAMFAKGEWLGLDELLVPVVATKRAAIPVQVQLLSHPDAGDLQFVLGGSASLSIPDEVPFINIRINTAYPAGAFVREQDAVRLEIRNVLLHEATHMADPSFHDPRKREKAGRAGSGLVRSIDMVNRMRGLVDDPAEMQDVIEAKLRNAREYYNNPMELAAFTQQMIDEVQTRLGRKAWRLSFKGDTNRMIGQAIKQSPTWQRIRPHLSEKNQRRVRSTAYRAAMEALEGK